jgi:hypothetical protein
MDPNRLRDSLHDQIWPSDEITNDPGFMSITIGDIDGLSIGGFFQIRSSAQVDFADYPAR